MIRLVVARRVPLVAAGLVTAQASCALFYDFEGEGGAGATGSTTISGTTASRGEGTTASQSTADAITASGSTSSGEPWKCRSTIDCFGAACHADGTCAEATITLSGNARGLHIHKVGDVPTVSVITAVTASPTGIVVSSVISASEVVKTTEPLTPDPDAIPGFVGHDQDEILLALRGPHSVQRHFDGVWETPVDYTLAPPAGAGGQLNVLLSSAHGWIGVANDKLLSFTPSAGAWGFAAWPVDSIAHPGWLGHTVVHYAGNEYALSMFSPVNDPDPGCLAMAEYAAGSWTVQCKVSGLSRLSSLASDGREIAYRSQVSDAELVTADVVSTWNPRTNATREISRSATGSLQSVAVDGDGVYFDANTIASGPALFRCSKTADATQPPDDVCEQLLPGFIGGLGSLRLAPPPDERFLVCWAVANELTCRVTR